MADFGGDTASAVALGNGYAVYTNINSILSTAVASEATRFGTTGASVAMQHRWDIPHRHPKEKLDMQFRDELPEIFLPLLSLALMLLTGSNAIL